MTDIHLTKHIPAELAGERLDFALANLFPEYSRSRLKTWIEQEHVRLNGQHVKPRDKVAAGDSVEILTTVATQNNWQSDDIALNIIYEDDDLLIINKPAGLIVHPGAGNPHGTLLNALMHHNPALKELPRGGIVHRIDKDTTGLLVVAKTLEAHTALVQQLQEHSMEREYLAICQGTLISGGTIDKPMARHHQKRTQMAISMMGKPAVTHYRIIEKFKAHTFLRIQLETGRTHQIRVHMADMNHALVGDPVYGRQRMLPKNISDELKTVLTSFKRQALHAHTLGFIHPRTGEHKSWSVDMPDDMQHLLKALQHEKNK